MQNKHFSFILKDISKIFWSFHKKRLKRRRRKKHLHNMFTNRRKNFTLYYQPFDSHLIRLGNKINFKKSLYTNKNFYNITIKSQELSMINIKPLKSLKFSTQKYLRSEYVEKYYDFFINIFPDFWLTSKPKSVRMGKGKGSLQKKVYFMKKGVIFFSLKYLYNYNLTFLNNFFYFFKLKIFTSLLLKRLKTKLPVKNVVNKIIY